MAADVNTSIKYDKQGTEYGEGSLKLLQNLGKKDKSNTDYGGDRGDKFFVYKLKVHPVKFAGSEKKVRKLAMRDKKAKKYLKRYKK